MFAAYILAHAVVLRDPAGRGALDAAHRRRCRKAVLFPVVLVLCVVGAYALNNTVGNVYVLAVFGVLGYLMVKFGFPLAPFILGVILGDQIEINLVRAIMTDADPLALPDAADLGRAARRSRSLRSSPRSGSTAATSGARRRADRGGGGRFLSCGAAIVERTRAALAAGALQPIATEQSVVEDAGVRFVVRSVSSLERKRLEARRLEQAGGRAAAREPAHAARAAADGRRHHRDARRRAQQVSRSSSTICSS